MELSTLTKLLDAGFTRDDIVNMGLLQPAAPEPEKKPEPAPEPEKKPEPEEKPVPEQAGLSAEQALVQLIGKLDARISDIQAANLRNDGFQEKPARTAEDVITELVDPYRPQE